MPDAVDECVESVLDDHPDYDESRAYAICNAKKTGEIANHGVLNAALQDLAQRGDTDRMASVMDAIDTGQKSEGNHELLEDGTICCDNSGREYDRSEVGEKSECIHCGESVVAFVSDWDQADEIEAEAGIKSVATVSGKQAPLKPKAVPDVDPENPPEEFTDALEAEDFVVYGKASIEKFDDGGQNSDVPEVIDLSPETVEKTLGRFFDSEKAPGIISIGHDDIPVGRPLREYELPEDTAIEVGGDTYEFSAGETITTHVEDADGDDRPELWLVADLAKDTEIARKARLGVLAGELDGFSVTFGRRAVEDEGEGRRVTEYDLFSVTLAPDEMVANKGAEFDLAAFKAKMNRYSPTAGGNDAVSPENGLAEQLAAELTNAFDQALDKNE